MKTDVVPSGGLYAGASFALSGPVDRLDGTRLPVRGDLAHIRLAGKVFVPHYVAPLHHRTGAMGATLMTVPGGEALATLEPGAGFDVLDIAGSHAWGEVTGGGIVGYIALNQLENPA